MTLRVPPDTSLRFSVLEFPYKNAVKAFMWRFEEVYKQKHPNRERLPFDMRLPYRQLNDALLALAPSLIQGFDGDYGRLQLITFTRYEHGKPEEFPNREQLRNLIRLWLERWAAREAIAPLLAGDGQQAWRALMDAVNGDFESDWLHDIDPAELAADPSDKGGLGYLALPALLTQLLHGAEMTIRNNRHAYPLTWRRAHMGDKKGLHLVTQPILHSSGDYFAYRLDFAVETQAGILENGKLRPWIFAHVSIQRYLNERYRGGDKGRDISVLVGCNQERFTGGWERDTTLIRLPIELERGEFQWASGVGQLLDDYQMRRLVVPRDVLEEPRRYGITGRSKSDEYYVIYAEGRKFGDERERGHKVPSGITLRERSQIMAGILSQLGGWLEVSPSFKKDAQNLYPTFALRDYDYMVKKRTKSIKQRASWRAALETALANSGHQHLHLIVLCHHDDFEMWAQKQISEALMGADLVTVNYLPLPLSLYTPLDPGELDPAIFMLPAKEKPKGYNDLWFKQMRASYWTKRDEWRAFLRDLGWQPNARRMLLIDSTGEKGMHQSQQIKGAVRDACHCEGILSQFIVGELKMDQREKYAGQLDGKSAGRLKNAALDLLVRQQGILYAPPHEIYERAAQLDTATARQLDVIAFCRMQRTKQPAFHYVLAVRLRATGEVDVMLHDGEPLGWLPYTDAANELGRRFSETRKKPIQNGKSLPSMDLKQKDMLRLVYYILSRQVERPTLAVIEAEGWRNAPGTDTTNHGWKQLQNPVLSNHSTKLDFGVFGTREREAPALDNLLGVIRLRMNRETPQYVTAGNWADEDTMHDMPHATGYVDPCAGDVFHYMSIAKLSETQKRQKGQRVVEAFRGDIRADKKDDMDIAHPQIIEMVPFFVHPRFQTNEGLRQLCRCIHFLRMSPAFTMGELMLPYPMHLGEALIRDQLVIVGADD